jgi:hypothetical protein
MIVTAPTSIDNPASGSRKGTPIFSTNPLPWPAPSQGSSGSSPSPSPNAATVLPGTADPDQPHAGSNWIKTVPGKGWFPIFRFYSPTEPFFDKTWVLNDLEAVQ